MCYTGIDTDSYDIDEYECEDPMDKAMQPIVEKVSSRKFFISSGTNINYTTCYLYSQI